MIERLKSAASTALFYFPLEAIFINVPKSLPEKDGRDGRFDLTILYRRSKV